MTRFFETVPGVLTWLTLILMVVASWQLPVAAAIFIILFDIYFLLKAIYLSFHLRAAFRLMKQHLAVDWLAKLEELGPRWHDVYHLVILPMSVEPYEVVKESFETLANSKYPKDRLLVVLSGEERMGERTLAVAQQIKEEFGGMFGKLLTTVHPKDVPGELPGKGSNEAWAGKEALRLIVEPMKLRPEHVLVSVFDVDTQIPAGYFGRVTHAYLTVDKPLRAIYQPVPLFVNNIYHAPALARVISFSTTFWQMMQQARPERLTSFSSQTIPLPALIDVGFWQKDIVSEDSRIFWQCLLRYDGDFRVEPLAYPVSMDTNVAPKFWQTMKNLYKQQRRWAWGSENVPYVLQGLWKNKRFPRGRKWYWILNTIEGYHSWATNSLIIFALGWLPVLLGGRDFNDMLLAYSLPKVTRLIVSLSMVGVATSAIMGIVLLPPRPDWFKPRHMFLYVLQWALLPITLILFGAVPAIDAQTRLMVGGRWRLGFWATPKSRQGKDHFDEDVV